MLPVEIEFRDYKVCHETFNAFDGFHCHAIQFSIIEVENGAVNIFSLFCYKSLGMVRRLRIFFLVIQTVEEESYTPDVSQDLLFIEVPTEMRSI